MSCDCDHQLPDLAYGARLYCVLSAVDDDTGLAIDFTGETVALLMDPLDPSGVRATASGVVQGDTTKVLFSQTPAWCVSNLPPGKYEVRIREGDSTTYRIVGPVMQMNVVAPPHGAVNV